MRISRPSASASAAFIAAGGVLALLIAWLSIPPGRSDAGVAPVAAAPAGARAAGGAGVAAGAVSGTVFYDKNDNGVRDPGEPGIEGIRIHDKAGDASTLTGPDGSYALSGLPASGYLQVETGWFRSQCPPASKPTATSCGAGPGSDNDYSVVNQFLRYMLTASNASNVDVGLVPDWPGRSMTIPDPVGGVVPSNPVDVAARLSWSSGKCAGGAYEICRDGDTFAMTGQIFDQGTTPLTGIEARVYVPPGDCATGASLISDTIPDGLDALSVVPATPTCATRYLDLSLGGSLVPAGGVEIRISGKTESGPGTPGCNPKKVNAMLCPTMEPQGRGWLLGVSHIDQIGDPDSTFCAAGDMTQCPIGIHDKRRSPDELDPAGHNVDAALAGSTAYDLRANAEMLDSRTVRAFVSNPTLASSPEKAKVKIWLPAGTTVETVPPKHVLITCDSGKASGAAIVVTCTLGGPVAPTISSPAIDLTLGSTPEQVVVCVTPPAGSPVETVPAGTGCRLSTTATSTPTDNDATLFN